MSKREPVIIRVMADSFDRAIFLANAAALELCQEGPGPDEYSENRCHGAYLRFKGTELYVRPWRNRLDETEFTFELEWQP